MFKLEKIKKQITIPKIIHFIYILLMIGLMMSTTVFAAGTDIWSKAEEIMKAVYTSVLGISTVAAVVTASIALLLMNFSKSGKTVDESRSWLKRIAITWAILNSLGFIMAWVVPYFQGGQWNG